MKDKTTRQSMKHRKNLEELVDERTAELRMINEKLQKKIAKRKKAEKELRDSEERLRILFDYAPDAYYLNDLKGNFIDGNKAAEKLTGYKREELVGKNFLKLKLLPPAQMPKATAFSDKNLMGKATGPDEFVLTRKDGTRVYVEISTNPVKVKGRTVILGIARDISKVKQVENKLKLERAYIDQLFESAQEAIVMADKNGHVMRVNDEYIELFGFSSHDELLGKSVDDIIVPDDAREIANSITNKVRMGDSVSLETVRQKKDGSLIDVSVLASPIVVDGKLLGTFGIYRDISERIESEKKLKESAAYLDMMGDALVVLDSQARVIRVNKIFSIHWGYTPNEVLGKPVFGLFKKEELSKHKSEMEKAIIEGGVREFETVALKKDKKEIDVSVSGTVLKDNKGELLNFIALFRDISERKRTEEQIKKSLNEKEILLREIHHRVKNNMQIISSLLRLQSRTIKDEHVSDMFKVSQNRIKSMALIHETLYKSKDFTKVDFSNYLRNITTHLFSAYHPESERIRLKLDVGRVSLDINKAIPCGQIINEILSNSLKHAFPEGSEGEINVWLKMDKQGKSSLVIKDTGVGFPKGFDFRKTETLGMQIITDLVNQLEGTIELDRESGTKFKITF